MTLATVLHKLRQSRSSNLQTASFFRTMESVLSTFSKMESESTRPNMYYYLHYDEDKCIWAGPRYNYFGILSKAGGICVESKLECKYVEYILNILEAMYNGEYFLNSILYIDGNNLEYLETDAAGIIKCAESNTEIARPAKKDWIGFTPVKYWFTGKTSYYTVHVTETPSPVSTIVTINDMLTVCNQ